jgi:hypothetical protein
MALKDSTKRTARTVLQTALGLALALPFIVAAAGLPLTAPVVVGVLAVAGGFARVMALPQVQALLPDFLRTDISEDADGDGLTWVDTDDDGHPVVR